MAIRITLLTLLLVLSLARGARGGKPTLELVVGDRPHVGMCLARDDRCCWLQAPDGRLSLITLKDVTSYRKVSSSFRGLTAVEAREQLGRELGREFEVAAAGQYVVAAPHGRARTYADLLDRVHRSFTTFFSRRSFDLPPLEFPLMAVVYPDEASFAAYCRQDGMTYVPGLKGYYSPESNRIALFDDEHSLVLRTDGLDGRAADDEFTAAGLVNAATIQAELRDTLVHEATHQLAFNTGLHPRIGQNPRWVVEGLAMIFERNVDGGQAARYGDEAARLNGERYDWFMHRARARLISVEDLVGSDRPFGSATLDAYSEAWALTFYLSERHSAEYVEYLELIRARDPLAEYSAEARIADFQKCFGDDLAWLQVQWLRFMDELE
jgi:hypothetical protein